MARGITYLVFILPIVFSVGFGAVVLADVLQEPDRELNMWPIDFSKIMESHEIPIEIVGLEKTYSISTPIQIQVQISDSTLDCGDLYITIFSINSKDIISQRGFFEQCFGENPILPLGDNFSEIVDTVGEYEIVVEMTDKNQKNMISIIGEFAVK